MRKSRYVTILLAATALAACDDSKTMTDASGQSESTIYGDVNACAKDNDAGQCQQSFEAAKAEHTATAPKFKSTAECEAAGFNKCEETKTVAADGTQHGSGIFMPMMMGYMMGRMLGGGTGYAPGYAPPQPQAGGDCRANPNAPGCTRSGGGSAGYYGGSRPVYADRSGTLYADGGNVVGRTTPGATSLGPSGIAARTVSRGGFGSSARGYSGGS